MIKKAFVGTQEHIVPPFGITRRRRGPLELLVEAMIGL